MTKSKGIGRGKGGGRPRKHPVQTRRVVTPEVKEAARQEAEKLAAIVTSSTALEPATKLAPLAYATLVSVMEGSTFDAPRVSAAKAILQLAQAAEQEAAKVKEAAAAANGVDGKKAQAKATAESKMHAENKFAAPPPPGMMN